MEQAKRVLPPAVSCCASEYAAAEGADAVVIVTEWSQFRALDFARLHALMRAPVIIDLRGMYRIEDMAAHGFHYFRLGAPQLVPAMPFELPARSATARRRQRPPTAATRSNGSTHRPGQRKRIAVAPGANAG
jgi:UDPglucose 6-dehydrogenase